MVKTLYKDREAILLENEQIAAKIIPNPGGKLASLVNRSDGFEFLVQKDWPAYRPGEYDKLFVDAECSGFDDMFPTIDPCHCEQAPWRGAVMPCHGEVWSLPWTAEEKSGGVALGVDGVRFPYRLEKTVRFASDSVLSYDYRLTNKSPFDFDYLWAGHLMINLMEGTKITIPEKCRRAVTVLSAGSRKFGDVQTWPDFLDRENRPYRADIVRSKSARAFEKFYFMEKLDGGFCSLDYPNGRKLTIRFSGSAVPYLGLLVNENEWDNLYNIIIEPCSIGFDRPDTAKRFGQLSTLPGGSERIWRLEIELL